jgi:hypothetical protein
MVVVFPTPVGPTSATKRRPSPSHGGRAEAKRVRSAWRKATVVSFSLDPSAAQCLAGDLIGQRRLDPPLDQALLQPARRSRPLAFDARGHRLGFGPVAAHLGAQVFHDATQGRDFGFHIVRPPLLCWGPRRPIAPR